MSLWNKMFGPKGEHTNEPLESIAANIADGKAVMLDVRSQEERDAGYVKDSIFIPITELRSLPDSTETVNELDKTKIVYCH